MARVSASTPGRSVTTYKTGKNGSASRRPGSTLKKAIVNPSPIAKHTKVASVVKRGRAPVEASSGSDDGSSSDGSASEIENDDLDGGEEEGFDPNLRNLVQQSGLKAGQFKAGPRRETPTTSRTLVNRSRPLVSVPRTSAATNDKTAAQYTDDEDGDGESTSMDDDSEEENHEQPKALSTRNKSRTALNVGKRGKENMQVTSKVVGHAKEQDAGRKFGKVVQVSADRHPASHKKPYDPPSKHPQRTSRTSARPEPQPIYARPAPPNKSDRVYELESSDTEATECTNDQHVFGLQEDRNERVVKEHRREVTFKNVKHRNEEPREKRGFEEAHSRGRDYDHMRPEIAPEWNSVMNVFHDIHEKMRMHKNKVNEAIAAELEPMHKEAEKLYNHLTGHQTEKMLSQQNLMENALDEHYETLHSAKHRMSTERKKLLEAMSQLGERYLKIQARKDEALTRAMKTIVQLEETQAQSTQGPKAEWEQIIEKAKAKAEKLLDPAVLSAKFAKQRKYIFQEVGI